MADQGTPMERVMMVNGAFLHAESARISILDRGFLFADGVYEVSAILDGRLIDNDAHLARLHRSLQSIEIPDPYSAAEWRALQSELVARNALREGLVYIQVTRGAAERDFAFPKAASSTVVMFTQSKAIVEAPLAKTGAAVITVPDIRWARRDIKSVALLAQVLAKQQAVQAGAAEALMVEDGFVTEGSSSNVFIVTQGKVIVTRPLSSAILPGITRRAILRLAAMHDLDVEERPFSVAECLEAREVFYTSATTFVVPVTSIDGKPIGLGTPGPLARQLRDLYIAMVQTE